MANSTRLRVGMVQTFRQQRKLGAGCHELEFDKVVSAADNNLPTQSMAMENNGTHWLSKYVVHQSLKTGTPKAVLAYKILVIDNLELCNYLS